VTNACGTSTFSQTVEIGDAPEVSIQAFPDLCAVYSFQPSAVVQVCNSLVQTYQWSFPGADILSSTNPVPPIITYPTSGLYTITLMVTNACGTTTESYTFEIFDLPMVLAANDGPVCEFGELQLIGSVPAFDSLQWSGPLNYSSTQLSPVISGITLAQAGDYVLTVWLNGCSNSDTTSVEVLPLPDLTVQAQLNPICDGDTVLLTVTGADSYGWTADPTLLSTSGDSVYAVPTVNTTYFVTGVDAVTGCINQDSILVIVNPLPTVEAGPVVTTCAGQSVSLGGSPGGGQWYDMAGNLLPGNLFPASDPGIYTVYYEYTDNQTLCTNTDSTQVCVTNLPDAGFTISATSGCAPFGVTLLNTSNTLDDCVASNYS
ncbi:MAG: PKD domain-containing protein, partial [Phaeodactylibacter sp.]|nr:PKD domain-containing protein [Phaeodactylibacter sp.]